MSVLSLKQGIVRVNSNEKFDFKFRKEKMLKGHKSLNTIFQDIFIAVNPYVLLEATSNCYEMALDIILQIRDKIYVNLQHLKVKKLSADLSK